MKQIRQAFNFYIFSNLHVALATFCLTKITLLEIGISENSTPVFVFLATLFSYNIIRFSRVNSLSGWFATWHKENSSYLYILTGLSFLGLWYIFFSLRLKAVLVLLPFLLCTLFYTFPIKKYALRNIPGLKLFLIAISWAGITVLFPLVQNYMVPRGTDYIQFVQRFLFVLTITIPFDIRDIQFDDKKLKTLPQRFGVKTAKLIGIGAIVLFLVLEFLRDEQHIGITLTIALLSTFLLVRSTVEQSKYYSAFFVEAIPIVWLLISVIN